MKTKILFLFLFVCINNNLSAQLKVTFPASDGVTVTADWYPIDSEKHTILLCHQNGFSRGEYLETAIRLNKFGFNCLAIDQRVGKEVNGIVNETAADAKARGLNPVYADAEKDIVAAIEYLYDKYRKKVLVLGSSYSASLALKIANEKNHVFAVASFSPGEYFTPEDFIASHIKELKKPVFLTSSREESAGVTDLTRDVISLIKVQYIPKGEGDHGSKVLWTGKPGNQDYWAALMSFLNRMKKENW